MFPDKSSLFYPFLDAQRSNNEQERFLKRAEWVRKGTQEVHTSQTVPMEHARSGIFNQNNFPPREHFDVQGHFSKFDIFFLISIL